MGEGIQWRLQEPPQCIERFSEKRPIRNPESEVFKFAKQCLDSASQTINRSVDFFNLKLLNSKKFAKILQTFFRETTAFGGTEFSLISE